MELSYHHLPVPARSEVLTYALRRCRYVGRLRCAIQAYVTAIVLNLKRMVKLLAGVSFKRGSGHVLDRGWSAP
jgi:hypothetical protein